VSQSTCVGSQVVETVGLAAAKRSLGLARLRRERSDDWPALFSGTRKLQQSLKEVSLGNALEKRKAY
jgi:hypothetical protein